MEDQIEEAELKLYTQLYEDSKPKGNEGLDRLKEKLKIYDINPNLNYKIMKKILDKKNLNDEDIDDFCNFYRDYIQTLFIEQKLDIIRKIKDKKNEKIKNKILFKLNEKSFIDSYFDIIKELCTICSKLSLHEKVDYQKLLNLFHYEYFVDYFNINTPLIYGTYELIFAGLINNLYFHFFVDKTENIVKENIDKVTGYAEYPESIMKKIVHKTKKKKNDVDNPGDINMDIEEEEEESSQKDFNIDPVTIDSRIYFINPFLIKILSDDFKEIFNLKDIKKENSSTQYEAKPKVNSLIFHLIYFELMFHIYNIYDNQQYLAKFDHQFFFETKKEKFKFFESMNKIRNEIIIVDENEKEVTKDKDITNKNYIVYNAKNRKEKIEFNPYDYILTKFTSVKSFNDLVKRVSNVNYFSLNKFYKENRLFENIKLDNLFKENIKETLSSKTINELFGQYINFSDYACPYSGEEKEDFIKQTFNITYYFPIPFKNISGFTYKKYGLIFISNINRFEEVMKPKDENILNKVFCKKINKISFIKVVHIHEIIGHYSCTIIHANNYEIPTSTPPNTFKDYEPKNDFKTLASKMDGGDKGESILLGNKIKYIYTKGALFIINNNNYNNNLEKFCNEFIKENKFKKGDILNLVTESEKNELISEIINQFYSEEKSLDSFQLTKENYSSFRIMDTSEKDEIIEDELFDKCISCFENETHIFPNYGRYK